MSARRVEAVVPDTAWVAEPLAPYDSHFIMSLVYWSSRRKTHVPWGRRPEDLFHEVSVMHGVTPPNRGHTRGWHGVGFTILLAPPKFRCWGVSFPTTLPLSVTRTCTFVLGFKGVLGYMQDF